LGTIKDVHLLVGVCLYFGLVSAKLRVLAKKNLCFCSNKKGGDLRRKKKKGLYCRWLKRVRSVV
jgi:hypothetical protein